MPNPLDALSPNPPNSTRRWIYVPFSFLAEESTEKLSSLTHVTRLVSDWAEIHTHMAVWFQSLYLSLGGDGGWGGGGGQGQALGLGPEEQAVDSGLA